MDEQQAALHAEVAAKLRRASSGSTSNGGGNVRATIRRPGGGSGGGGTVPNAAAVGAGGVGGGSRKLLHWTPQQWKDFEATPKYTAIVNTARILPIRAPLSSIYEIHFADEHANYTPSALMETLLAASREGTVVDVGLVLDATGSESFLHDVKEWEDWDVSYVKLRGLLPSGEPGADGDDATARVAAENALATQFFEQVEKHKAGENKDRDVAVFGANGYNFVGYLIVRYLIEYCGLPLHKALDEFASAVAPGIYSRYYLERLYRQYFATLPSSASTIKIRGPPKWDSSTATADAEAGTKIGSDILTPEDHQNKFVPKAISSLSSSSSRSILSAEIVPTGSTNSTPTNRPTSGNTSVLPPPPTYKAPLYIPRDREDANSRSAKRRKIRSWIDDVEPLEYGETIDPSSEEHNRLAKALEGLTGVEGFPGCEAIPLTATHIANEAYKKRGCLTASYLVTWRARGRRCLLFVAEGGVFVVSRDMTFTKVNMKFPRRRSPTECQVNTLIDGIIVEDQDHDNKVARFLAFDIVYLEGAPIWQKKLEKRLQCLQNEVIVPRKNDPSFDYANEAFRVRMKDHFRLAKAEFLLHKFVSDVTHEVDGVIFTPTEAPYNLGGFECDEPIFKFVASEAGGGIPGLDGSISKNRLLQYISTVPTPK